MSKINKENRSIRDIAKLTHMSFRDIGIIINKEKSKAEGERGQLDENDDIRSKSKVTQAFKLFSEGRSPIEVVIALDLPPNHVRRFWTINCRFTCYWHVYFSPPKMSMEG